MKKFVSFLALSMFATLGSAFAGTVYMDANDYATLPDCGGVVRTRIDNNATQLNLVFSNVVNCSNFDIVAANGSRVNYPNQKLQGANQSRNGSFTIPASLIDLGSNTIRVLIQSNSGIHADTIVISVRKVQAPIPTPTSRSSVVYMTSTDVKSLYACGGAVQTKVSNGQLNVIFQNVQNCSNFDIVAANGDRIDYPNLKLQGKDGARAGSFTLPKKIIDFGGNTVRISLKSNSGQTSEMIVINFLAF